MPNGWTRVGTPEHIKDARSNPALFKREVQKYVAGRGAALDEVYFEQNTGDAYALIHFAGTTQDAQAVVDELSEGLGSEVMVLLTVEELPEEGSEAA